MKLFSMREASEGTSYKVVRLVINLSPETCVLRNDLHVSITISIHQNFPNFALLKHGSPSVGLQNWCSYSNLTLKIRNGCMCTYLKFHFHDACRVDTQILAQTFNSCVPVSRRVEGGHVVRKERHKPSNRNEQSRA